MRGRIEQRQHEYTLSLHGAWQTERFARVDKLKSFGHYAKALAKKGPPARAQTPGETLSTFHALAAAGAALTFERIG